MLRLALSGITLKKMAEVSRLFTIDLKAFHRSVDRPKRFQRFHPSFRISLEIMLYTERNQPCAHRCRRAPLIFSLTSPKLMRVEIHSVLRPKQLSIEIQCALKKWLQLMPRSTLLFREKKADQKETNKEEFHFFFFPFLRPLP